MEIHGIFSSYFGEDEFDVGTSVRRNQLFFNTEYVLDLGGSDRTRAYVVDWTVSFPDVQSGYYQSNPPFFEPGGAEEWRRTAFEKADKAWSYADDDWICFVDATEGVSIDESLDLLQFDPDGSLTNPNMLQPWLTEEIAAASGDQISLPVYAFVGNSPVWITFTVVDEALQARIDSMNDKDIYISHTKHELNTINHTMNQECYQSWTLAGWSPRLFRVEALKDVDFDWTSIDTFTMTAPSDAASIGTSIVSYGYARWTDDFARIDRSVQRPMTEADDDGWRMRQKLSRVRPVDGLPFDDWNSSDTVGTTILRSGPPISAHPVDQEFNNDFDHSFTNFAAIVPTEPGADWDMSGYDPLMVLYLQIARPSPREGLFFLKDELGLVPWNFYTGQPALTAAQIAVRNTYKDFVEELPQKLLVQNFSPVGIGTAPPLHPNDTVAVVAPPVEVPEEPDRPRWNDGKWNRGKW